MTGPWRFLSQRMQDLGSLHGDGSVSVKLTQGQPSPSGRPYPPACKPYGLEAEPEARR
jgi:hypothetical protein